METIQAKIQSPYNSFFTILESFYPISEEIKKALFESTQVIHYPKGYNLFTVNEIVTKAYYIYKGIGRTFYYKEGREITNNFYAENQIITSPTSFFTVQPAYEIGELIEDSVLIEMSKETIEGLCLKYMALNYVMRKLGEIFYTALDQRFYSIHMRSAKERFDILMDTQPDLFHRAPLGQIASFLGMTQETLSRLRTRVGQKKKV